MVFQGILYAVFAAFCFGIMPILTKVVYHQTSVDPFFYLMIRYTLAAILIWSYLLASKKQSWREVKGADLGIIVITSISYIIVTSTYFIALQYVDASLNSLLVFTFPIFTPFLGLFFFKQKLFWFQIAAAMIGFAGCLLLIGNYHLKGIPGESLGIGLGLLSGVIYAVYTLLGQKITARLDPLTITAYNVLFVAAFFLLIRLPWLWLHPQPPLVYIMAAILAVVSTIFANTFYFESIQRIGAVKAGIFSSVEPFFTAVLATFFLGEHMGLFQWIGAFFIVGGMVVVQQPWRWVRR